VPKDIDISAKRWNPRSVVLAVCCGVLAALPWHFPWLFPATWIALAAWIAITPPAPRAACGLWLVGGIAFMTTALYWLPEAAALRLGVSYSHGALAAAAIIFWDAMRFGVFGYLVAWLRPRGAVGTLAWPVVWVALELVWPHVFPWRIGQTQLGWLSLCQIAEVTGVYGISFLLVWTSAAVGLWLARALSAAGAASAFEPVASGGDGRGRRRCCFWLGQMADGGH
jgi:apolipoprotein N-acyltransferase